MWHEQDVMSLYGCVCGRACLIEQQKQAFGDHFMYSECTPVGEEYSDA